jgi:predicted nucleic acid-binding protein
LSLYLDASARVPLFANDALSHRADSILRAHQSTLIVSDFAAAEFAAAIARRKRTGFLTVAEARTAFSNFDTWMGREAERVQEMSPRLQAKSVVLT